MLRETKNVFDVGRERERESDRQTDTERDRQKETDRDRERIVDTFKFSFLPYPSSIIK